MAAFLDWAERWTAQTAWSEAWTEVSPAPHALGSASLALAGTAALSGDLSSDVDFSIAPPMLLDVSGAVGLSGDVGFLYAHPLAEVGIDLAGALSVSANLGFPSPHGISGGVDLVGDLGLAGDVIYLTPNAFELGSLGFDLVGELLLAGGIDLKEPHHLGAVSLDLVGATQLGQTGLRDLVDPHPLGTVTLDLVSALNLAQAGINRGPSTSEPLATIRLSPGIRLN